MKLIIHCLSLLIMTSLSPQLNADERGPLFYPPTDTDNTMTIVLPDNLSKTIVAIELDNIDMSDWVYRDGNHLSFRPTTLPAGQHTLRLFELDDKGNSTEISTWAFITSGQAQQASTAEAWLKSASFSAETMTEFSHRLKNRNLASNAPEHNIISGSGQLSGQVQGENWTVNAEGNYLLQSHKSLRQVAAPLDVGEYSLSANHQGQYIDSQLTIGHHDTGLDNLLVSQFHRRGVSATIASKQRRVSANAFAFNVNNLLGSDNISGISDDNNRLSGASATIKPFSSDSNALTLTSLYYHGEQTIPNFGISSLDTVSTGSGWGISAQKKWNTSNLVLASHYAKTEFDLDGNSGLAPEDDSEAVAIQIEATPFDQIMMWDEALSLTVGSQYQRVDTFFKSLANQNLASDRDAVNLYTRLYWDKLSFDLQLSRETNNVDDLDGLPTDRLQQLSWNGSYVFTPSAEPNSWIGSPYLNFSGLVSKLDRDKTPTGYLGADTDNRTRSFTLSGGSNYETFYWTLSYTHGLFDDDTNSISDTSNQLSSVSLGWQVTPDLLVNSGLDYATFKERDNNNNSYDTRLGMGLVSTLIDEKLFLNVNYNLNRTAGDNDSPNRHIVNSELAWTFRQASYNRPGFSIALRGALEKTYGNTTLVDNQTSYQIFAVFKIHAPFSGQY